MATIDHSSQYSFLYPDVTHPSVTHTVTPLWVPYGSLAILSVPVVLESSQGQLLVHGSLEPKIKQGSK